MKTKKWLLMSILFLVIIVSGCDTVKDSKLEVEKNELYNGDYTNLTLEIDYKGQLGGTPNPQSFSVQFITGKYLKVKNERYGSVIEKDIIFNVTSSGAHKSYYLVAENLYSGQEVETVEAVLTSSDGKIIQKIRSDFILIKSR